MTVTTDPLRPHRAHIVDRVKGALSMTLPGDAALSPGYRPPDGRLTPAAVLVGLVERPREFHVLLTQRTDHLRDHAGQISFPGGKIEPDDEGPVHTALRETEEEVGLPPDRIEIVGELGPYVTGTGFQVIPVVGFIQAPYPVKLDPFEVADVFEVPLSHFLNPANRQRHTRKIRGQRRSYYAMPFEERFIWGATAGMLVNLAELLTARDI